MASADRGRRKNWLLVLLALVATLCPLASAQTFPAQIIPNGPSGILTGKLTDLYSTPLADATLTVRNQATGAQVQLTTRKNGAFRIAGLAPGVYTVEAATARLGRGHLEGIVVPAGQETRVLAAMEFEPGPTEAVSALPVPAAVASVAAPPSAAIDPLRNLNLIQRNAAQSPRETPSTHPAVISATVATESLRTLPMPASPLPSPSRIALTPQPVTVFTPTVKPLIAAASAGLAVSLATDAVRFAIQSANPPPTAASRPHSAPLTPAITTTVSSSELQALPIAGRRWQEFVLDSSIAAAGDSPNSSPGASRQPTETSIDGASTRTAFGGQGGSGPESSGPGSNGQGGRDQNGMGQAWAGGRGLQVAQMAIREVETAAGNIQSEESRAAGAHVNIQTQRGQNGLHGQLFFSDRQNTWGAQNPFTQWVKQTASATLTTPPVFTAESFTPPDHQSVWGLGLGRQIRRDKLFWFAALDTYRRNDPGLATVKHPAEFFAQPSNDQMQVLSARLGLSGNNPVAEGLQAYSNMLTTLAGLLGPAPRTAAQEVGFVRLDWQAAERHRITLEGIGALWNSPGGGLTRVSETFGNSSFGSSKASEAMLLGRWEAFLTPNLLAVWQGSMGRTIQTAHAEAPSVFEQSFLPPNRWGQLPQMVVDSRYGFTLGNPSRFGSGSYPDERVSQTQETLDWVHGPLLVRAGIEFSHNSDATSLLRNQTGTYYYSSAENFISDALSFANFGIAGQLNPDSQHNCDQTGKVWRDSGGNLRGLGYLPCYSYYSQVMGPNQWSLSTNDWAGFATTQWQPGKLLVVSGGLRWEREQLPAPLPLLANPELPLTGHLPGLGDQWGPRISLALGAHESHWPVLRLGYGMYFGRTENATLETALTQTGSLKGDLNFFMRPTDNLHAGGAPPFPYVLSGDPSSIVKPGAVEFAPTFRNPEIHQAVVAVEEALPSHVQLTASAEVSLGRRLPISMDTNFDPAINPGTITYAVVDASGIGPIKLPQITVPFYASWPSATSATGFAGRLNPDFQQVSQILSRANSTYEAATLKLVRYGSRGLSLHAHYTYAHAMDWNPNESTTVAGSDVLDPADFTQEYGTSNLDVRHYATAMLVIESPWKLHGVPGRVANGWMLSATSQFRSGLPYTMRTSGSLAEEFDHTTGAAIVALGPGMNGSGGDNRVYGIGRNTFRYPATWKADARIGKKFDLGRMRQLEILAESFNLFNHQNVTELETTGYYLQSGSASELPTLNFLTGLKANTTAFGQPLNVNATNFYRERQIQFGVQMRF